MELWDAFCWKCLCHETNWWQKTIGHFFRRLSTKITPHLTIRGRTEGPVYEAGSSAPVLRHRTSDEILRPDEHNIYKEVRLSVRQMEAAGKLKPGRVKFYRRKLAQLERKYGTESRFFKHTEVLFEKPAELCPTVQVGYGDNRKRRTR